MWDEHLDKKSVYFWKETPESEKRAEQRRTWLSCQSQCIASWLSVFRKEHGWVPWLKASPVIKDSAEHPCWPGDLLLPAAKLVHHSLTQQAASHKQGLPPGLLLPSNLSVGVPTHNKVGESQQRKPWHSFSTHLIVSVPLSQCFPSFWPTAKTIFTNSISLRGLAPSQRTTLLAGCY